MRARAGGHRVVADRERVHGATRIARRPHVATAYRRTHRVERATTSNRDGVFTSIVLYLS
jgi:hypothetical protein